MGDHILRLVPADPFFVPYAKTHEEAFAFVKAIFTYEYSEPQIKIYQDPQYIGYIIDEVHCPYCGVEIYEWWAKVSNILWREHSFRILEVTTPCCEKQSTLNDLIYIPDARFAQFVIAVRNPRVPNNGEMPYGAESLVPLPSIGTALPCRLSEVGLSKVGEILKCDIRQIEIET